ncbi:MAG: alpha-amylase family glycosyl hydrolase [Butyrivibrio sp.]|nr:alpha-amylase family glycosyl hydrolase [Butyrivibrio sp.]
MTRTHYNVKAGGRQAEEIRVARGKGYSLGAECTGGGWRFACAADGGVFRLLLYARAGEEPQYIIELDGYYKNGGVFSFEVTGAELEGLLYRYETEDKRVFADEYARAVEKREREDGGLEYYGVLFRDKFDWEGDVKPCLSVGELIMYKLHVRGFTRNRFSKVKAKGTFRGIAQKADYFEELGINAVELMPAYEFVNTGINNNYWGYDSGFYFAPNCGYSFTYGRRGDYTSEFKSLVRDLHGRGIEVYMEFFFPKRTAAGLIDDCLRFWKNEYRIDGAHIICDERARLLLAGDVFLKDMKLFYTDWYRDCGGENLLEYNEGFLGAARRFIKGDEDQLRAFLYAMRKKPDYAGCVNFVACNNGFTLADVYAYDRKHNEANGESNRDGADYNFSWNCGVEGATRKRRVNELRLQLMKNAAAFLMLAQGVPMIYSGDEFGNSQDGNNNAYCQDNELGWVDWGAYSRNRRFFEFVKMLVAFRKEHKILHADREPMMADYKFLGLPDISYHGTKAWYPELEHYSRHAGILYCGAYAGDTENIYLAFNMHWEPHELALPSVSGRSWELAFSTDGAECGLTDDGRAVKLGARSLAVFTDAETAPPRSKK